MIDLRFPTAVHMVLTIAVAGEKAARATSFELARGLNANPSMIRKLLVPLGRHGIIESSLGKMGGVRLGRSPETITLWDIYRASTEEKRLWASRQNVSDRCIVSSNITVFFDHLVDQAEDALKNVLSGWTVLQCLEAIQDLDQRRLTELKAIMHSAA
jgi:Rrf2 family transcriptional repressor of oqxAB